MPVRSSVPDIDFFDRPTPHVSMSDDVQPTFRLGPVVGYVRVTLSNAPLLAARRQALWQQLLVVCAAGLVGVAIVALMARRFSASLGGVLAGLRSLLKGRYDVPESARAGGDLGRVQHAVVALAEELAAQAHGRGAGTAAPGATGAPEPSAPAGGGTAADRAPHDRIARRIIGRVDAALLALRLAALHAARLAEVAKTDEERQRVNEIALRVLGIADQANAAGAAVLEPMRWRIVEGAGLDAALEELLRACAQAHPACLFEFRDGADLSGVDSSSGVRLHRTLQDAMSHLVAFSDASEAAIRLEMAPDAPEIRITITDNGEGEESSVAAARLARIRDELTACGGRMDVTRSPTRGTKVVLIVPATRPGGWPEA
jgi:signal transduction histidine kinase